MPWLKKTTHETVDKAVDSVDKNRQNSAILGIYAKQPVSGECKTRLCPPLTLDEAAAFYRCSLEETVNRMQTDSGFDLAICFAGNRDWFAENFPGITLIPQQGADLGARMANSLNGFLQQGYKQAVLIGTDAPDLPLELVTRAFSALQQAKVVIAPATDGGYVLIGEAQHHPELFVEIAWSTAEVLATTLQRIEQLNIPAVTLDSWEDLDDLRSLQRFLRRSPASRTAQYLAQRLAAYFPGLKRN